MQATHAANGWADRRVTRVTRPYSYVVPVRSFGVHYVVWRAPYGFNNTATLYVGLPQLSGITYGDDGTTMFVNDSSAVIAERVDNQALRHRLPRGLLLASGGRLGRGAAARDTSDPGRLISVPGVGGEARVVLSTDQQFASKTTSARVSIPNASVSRGTSRAPRNGHIIGGSRRAMHLSSLTSRSLAKPVG